MIDFVGAQGRNRTSDTRIFSPLLYQLSYLGAVGRQAALSPAHPGATGFIGNPAGGVQNRRPETKPTLGSISMTHARDVLGPKAGAYLPRLSPDFAEACGPQHHCPFSSSSG